eukprot:9498443-Pyramimonas_sp.AAC.1
MCARSDFKRRIVSGVVDILEKEKGWEAPSEKLLKHLLVRERNIELPAAIFAAARAQPPWWMMAVTIMMTMM